MYFLFIAINSSNPATSDFYKLVVVDILVSVVVTSAEDCFKIVTARSKAILLQEVAQVVQRNLICTFGKSHKDLSFGEIGLSEQLSLDIISLFLETHFSLQKNSNCLAHVVRLWLACLVTIREDSELGHAPKVLVGRG